MNRRTILLMFTALVAARSGQADAGAVRAQAAFSRPTGRGLTTLGRMELVDRLRAPRVREVVTGRVDRGRGETAYLVRFLKPREIAGTGLLSPNSGHDGSTEQSLYRKRLAAPR